MSKYHFFYNTSGSIDRALSRHRLGDEELCEAVENCAAEALAIYLVEDGEVDEDYVERSFATFAVADIWIRRMTLTSLLLGTNDA